MSIPKLAPRRRRVDVLVNEEQRLETWYAKLSHDVSAACEAWLRARGIGKRDWQVVNQAKLEAAQAEASQQSDGNQVEALPPTRPQEGRADHDADRLASLFHTGTKIDHLPHRTK